eukprot:548915-Pleurochrysis_carterae.AAC.2
MASLHGSSSVLESPRSATARIGTRPLDKNGPCGPTKLLATCSSCFTSPTMSVLESVKLEDGSAVVKVQSVTENCLRKIVHGDAWMVEFVGASSRWRTYASYVGDGEYQAHVHRDELAVSTVNASFQLWWTSSSPTFLEDAWTVLATAPFSRCSLPSSNGSRVCVEDTMRCVGRSLPSLSIAQSANITKVRTAANAARCQRDGRW